MNNQERVQARIARDKARKAAKRQPLLDKYGTFENVITNQNLHASLRKRRRNVEWKGSVQRYLQHAIVKIHRQKVSLLAGEINVNKKIRPMTVSERGKNRNVQGVLIDTRVVQGVCCDSCITPITQPTLIYDNPASTKGKGVGKARDRVQYFLEGMARKYKNDFYVMTYDFSGFFDSIPHWKCQEILVEDGVDERLTHLIMYMMKMYKEQEILQIKDKDERERKLAALANNEMCGATLGSQESQDFALAVPNKVDHLLKDKERLHKYIRYMDDGFGADQSKERLFRLLEVTGEESMKAGLKLNKKKTRVIKASKGFVFLKIRYIVTDTGHIIKKITRDAVTRMRHKLVKFKRLVDKGLMALDNVFNSFKSWFGNAKKNTNSFRSRKTMLNLYNRLFHRYRTGGMVA